MTWKIYGQSPMLSIVVDGWEVFGMSLSPVAPDKREWLAAHLDQRFEREIDRAKNEAVTAYKAELRKMLGVL